MRSVTALVVVDSFPCIWDHIRMLMGPVPRVSLKMGSPRTDLPDSATENFLAHFRRTGAIWSAFRYLPVTPNSFTVA